MTTMTMTMLWTTMTTTMMTMMWTTMTTTMMMTRKPLKSRKAKPAKKKSSKSKAEKKDLDIDLDLSGIEKQIESALGPDFEKKIEAWAEKFSKEIEEKFGDNSEFVKKMEALGKEMEKKFGDDSEFAKKMEAVGKEMEKKFGPAPTSKRRWKEKFGPGSEFEKKMEAVGKEMEKKFGPGSEFEKKIKEKAESARAKTLNLQAFLLAGRGEERREDGETRHKVRRRSQQPRAAHQGSGGQDRGSREGTQSARVV